MAEEKTEYSKYQSLVMDKILSKKDTSTTVLCADDQTTAQMRNLERYLGDKRNNTPDNKAYKQAEEDLLKIYQDNTYCAHCGKKATVTGPITKLVISCDCDESKKEVADKAVVAEESQKLDNKFFEIQKAAINKAFGVYKTHYAENVKKRNEELKKFDDEIMNISSL